MSSDEDNVDVEVVLDARGERCPLPVIRLGRLARDLSGGALVRLLATDPAARSDVAAFCRMRGHTLEQTLPDADEPGVTSYLVRLGSQGQVSGTRVGEVR